MRPERPTVIPTVFFFLLFELQSRCKTHRTSQQIIPSGFVLGARPRSSFTLSIIFCIRVLHHPLNSAFIPLFFFSGFALNHIPLHPQPFSVLEIRKLSVEKSTEMPTFCALPKNKRAFFGWDKVLSSQRIYRPCIHKIGSWRTIDFRVRLGKR